MNLGAYLFGRLQELGIDCTFGVPGDFALPLYQAQQQAGMRTVVCTHEPNAGFAADAYARLRGMGVVLVTYGAGALNVVNVTAMSYAEHSPLLVISGSPDTKRRGPDVLVHHLVKSFESQRRVFDEITVAAASLDRIETAAAEIERVLEAVRVQRRPGYLEIPRNLVEETIQQPVNVLRAGKPLPHKPLPAVEEAGTEIVGRLASARRPVLYAGVGIRRFGLSREVVRLAERWSLPVVSSVMGKASFPESHPQYAGIYMGAFGDPAARRILEHSDAILSLGVIQSDVNTGFWTAKYDPRALIEVAENATRIGYHRYAEVPITGMVEYLAHGEPPEARRFQPLEPEPSAQRDQPDALLRTAELIAALRAMDATRYAFLADVGDAWFVGLELRAEIFLAPGYYATMGFAVPGALGAGLAEPKRRPLVLVGDGAFRMTGTELSTLAELQLRPIVIVLNNSSYAMLEALDSPRPWFNLRTWDYVAFARALGCAGERVTTAGALQSALRNAEDATVPYLIEAILDKRDVSPVMRKLRAHWAALRKHAAEPTK